MKTYNTPNARKDKWHGVVQAYPKSDMTIGYIEREGLTYSERNVGAKVEVVIVFNTVADALEFDDAYTKFRQQN